jgi:hypothetical protein
MPRCSRLSGRGVRPSDGRERATKGQASRWLPFPNNRKYPLGSATSAAGHKRASRAYSVGRQIRVRFHPELVFGLFRAEVLQKATSVFRNPCTARRFRLALTIRGTGRNTMNRRSILCITGRLRFPRLGRRWQVDYRTPPDPLPPPQDRLVGAEDWNEWAPCRCGGRVVTGFHIRAVSRTCARARNGDRLTTRHHPSPFAKLQAWFSCGFEHYALEPAAEFLSLVLRHAALDADCLWGRRPCLEHGAPSHIAKDIYPIGLRHPASSVAAASGRIISGRRTICRANRNKWAASL